MIRWIPLIALGLLVAVAPCMAVEYGYVSADQLKERLASGRKPVILDLQPADEFRERHFDGSTWIGPQPGADRRGRKKLVRIGKRQLKSAAQIVIVSCTGAKDARQALDELARLGIARKRLLILEHGMDAAMHGVGCECCLTKEGGTQQPLTSAPAENSTR